MTQMKPNHIPFFSVVTCTYNRADLIGRALDSLAGQTCQDWECIIVDDESTDHTVEVITPYLEKGFRYIRHSHRGCARSKNAGMWEAKGRYITFLDSDDEYKPEHLEIRRRVLKKRPDLDLLYSDVEVIGDAFVPDRNHPGKLIAIADCVVGGTFFLDRLCAIQSGGFEDVPLGDDALLMEKLKTQRAKIKKIIAATYIYHRDSPNSMCTDVLYTPS